MGKSTQVNVNVDGVSLSYYGMAGKKLLRQQVFCEKYDSEDGFDTTLDVLKMSEHDPAIVNYAGEDEVMSLMIHDNFIPALMSCVGIHHASYIIGVLQIALDKIGEGYEQDISISFTVFC